MSYQLDLKYQKHGGRVPLNGLVHDQAEAEKTAIGLGHKLTGYVFTDQDAHGTDTFVVEIKD